MKKIYTLLIIFSSLIGINDISAQTYTMDWGSSFSPAWAAGSTTRTSTAIGSSGITATVTCSSTQATAMSAFAGFTSPQVSSAGFPFNTQLGSNVANLAVGMDLSSNANYVDITVSFSGPVNNVVFNVADIDKTNATSTTYYDEILVTGLNVATAVTNPTITKLNGTPVNATTDTVIISGNIARTNTISGRGGNTPSNSTDQNGTVIVNFGTVTLTSITIRYRNSAGAQANPAQQAIGIGNIRFQKVTTLPVSLTVFSANENNNGIELHWTTQQEFNADKFIIEKSNDGFNWQVLTFVSAAGNSNTPKNYSATDMQPSAVNYYRLKQVDINGAYVYSKVIRINKDEKPVASLKVFPNPVTVTATISTSSSKNQPVKIKIYSNIGLLVKEITSQLNTGTNNIDIPFVNVLSNGLYVVSIEDASNKKIGTVRFIKQ